MSKCPNCGTEVGTTAAEMGKLGGSKTSAAKRAAAIQAARIRWQRIREAREQALSNREESK